MLRTTAVDERAKCPLHPKVRIIERATLITHSHLINQSGMWNITIQCTNNCIKQIHHGSLALMERSKHSEVERLWCDSVAYFSYPLKGNAFINTRIFIIEESNILTFLGISIIMNIFNTMTQISNIWLFFSKL